MKVKLKKAGYFYYIISIVLGVGGVSSQSLAGDAQRIERLNRVLTLEIVHQHALERKLQALRARIGAKTSENKGTLWEAVQAVESAWQEQESKARASESDRVAKILQELDIKRSTLEDQIATNITNVDVDLGTYLVDGQSHIDRSRTILNGWNLPEKIQKMCDLQTAPHSDLVDWAFCSLST